MSTNKTILQIINKKVASIREETNESKIIDLEKEVITLVDFKFGSIAKEAVMEYFNLKDSDSATTEEIYKVIEIAEAASKKGALNIALAFFKAAELTENGTVHWSCIKLAVEHMEKAYNEQTIHAVQQFVLPRKEGAKFSTAIMKSYDLAAELGRIIELHQNK